MFENVLYGKKRAVFPNGLYIKQVIVRNHSEVDIHSMQRTHTPQYILHIYHWIFLLVFFYSIVFCRFYFSQFGVCVCVYMCVFFCFRSLIINEQIRDSVSDAFFKEYLYVFYAMKGPLFDWRFFICKYSVILSWFLFCCFFLFN